jgi:hypothetical protein
MTLDLTPLRSVGAGVHRDAVHSAAAETNRRREKLARMDAELAEAKADLERIAELQSRELVDAIITDAPPPAKPKREARLRNLRERIEGLTSARPVQATRVAEAERCEADARTRLADAYLPALAGLRLQAVQQCGVPLNSLIQSLAVASALDVIQDRLVGRDFTTPEGFDHRGLFRATVVLKRLHESLSPHLRQLLAPELADVDQYVARVAEQLLEQIELQ